MSYIKTHDKVRYNGEIVTVLDVDGAVFIYMKADGTTDFGHTMRADKI